MAVTFNPKNTYIAWPDFSGTGGHIVKADKFQVTEGGAVVFSSYGDDGVLYVTRVLGPNSYAHIVWYPDAHAIDESKLLTTE